MSRMRKKQSSGGILCKRRPEKFRKIHRKILVLESLFLKKSLWHRYFPVNFARFLRKPFLTEHLRWLLLAFQSESTLYSFRTSCSKQAQYLKFKWKVTSWKYSHSNIIQISSLCYVAGFQTPSMKMCSGKKV